MQFPSIDIWSGKKNRTRLMFWSRYDIIIIIILIRVCVVCVQWFSNILHFIIPIIIANITAYYIFVYFIFVNSLTFISTEYRR